MSAISHRVFLSLAVLALSAVAALGEEAPPCRLPFTRSRADGKKTEVYTVVLRTAAASPLKLALPGAMSYDARKITLSIADAAKQPVFAKDFDTVKGAIELVAETPPLQPGVYTLTVAGEGSYWSLDSRIKIEPAVKAVFPVTNSFLLLDNSTWFFMVPAGATKATIEAVVPGDGGAAFTVFAPSGAEAVKAVVPSDPKGSRAAFDVTIRSEDAGKPWKIQGQSGCVVFTFKGEGAEIPAFLSLSPEAFFIP